ncbi:hypothetical protein RJ640_014171 [Escallonia rubra]|uniref:Pentatricopeptide repeat-containing protein n=1 Tax=Escallonia rubra TaxID=112253 RepID=A0AA88R6P8_9ASTE|nr:hypothetical protein RJ640_014171 [Escallonia rubra]
MDFTHLIRSFADTRSVLRGIAVHCKLITSGFHPDVYLNNHLITMYYKFNRINDARKLFDQMPERNLISWTTLISSYSQLGLSEEALNTFRLMVTEGFEPNQYTYVSALTACTSIGDSRTGKEIHGRIFRLQQDLNSFVSNCLVNLYGKCGLLKSARVVFDTMLEPNQVSWASLISCSCQCGENLEGLKIFLRSRNAGVRVNEVCCATLLGASTALEYLKLGKQLHSLAVKCGIRMDQFVVTGLVNFYVKCGESDSAHRAFWEVDKPHFTAWTALIAGCVQSGKGREAINIFVKLHSSGMKPSEITFSSVFGAFAEAKEIEIGKQVHSLIIKSGFSSFTFVGNAVLAFYSKSGFLEGSLRTFGEMDARDVVTWNTLIAGHVYSGLYQEAVELLRSMMLEGFDLNFYTHSCILSICGDLPAVEWGKQTHCYILKPGFYSNIVVGSALIDMYAKCGRLGDAQNVFDNLPSKNLVSWNTMLVGYAQHGFGREALEIYDIMRADGVEPNDITFIGILSACGHVGLLEEGLRHFESMTKDYEISPRADHLACMVSIFGRKGQTKGAYKFISSFPGEPDKVVWRCLLSSCKAHKDLELGKIAAENILRTDPDDTSAHIMLSNIYAESKMWNETADIRRLIKEKTLKKDPGYSWTELKNKIYSFSAGHNVHYQGNNVPEVLNGLTAQLYDEGYAPDAMLVSQNEE